MARAAALHLLRQLIVGDTKGEQRTTLSGKDIGRGTIDGELICSRNDICPPLTLEPSAASKASVRPGHRVLPANDTELPHHVTDLAGAQIRQVKRTRNEAAIGR